MCVEGKPELWCKKKSRTHVKRDAASHVGQIILRVLTCACAKDTLRLQSSLPSFSSPDQLEIFFATSVKPRENEFEK